MSHFRSCWAVFILVIYLGSTAVWADETTVVKAKTASPAALKPVTKPAASPAAKSTPAPKATTASASATTQTKADKSKKRRSKGFTAFDIVGVSLSYFSWGETVTLTQGSAVDHTHSNMLGNSLTLDWEHYYSARWGFDLLASFLYGVADVGGTQHAVSYNLVNQNWKGFGGSAHMAYRLSKWAIVSAGPLAILRDLTLPMGPSGAVADFGSKMDYGATVALKMRLSDWLDIREEVGNLMKRRSTYWSVGLGYMF